MKTSGGKRSELHPTLKSQPLISIIIVTYNAGKYLRNCLKSIGQQELQNIELLIFDGASSDDTVNIIKEHETIITYWQSEPDNGIYDAMNKAAKRATGKFLYFLGADDLLLDGFSKMAGQLANENTMYYGYCLRDNIPTGGKMSSYKVVRFNICHHAIFYPAVAFKKYNYNTKYKVYADHALNMIIWGDKTIKKKFVPFAIANYSSNGFSAKTEDEEFRKDKLKLVKENMGWLTYLRFLKRSWKEARKQNDKFL